MKSFISLFSDCLTTSDSIKAALSNALIIFEWGRPIMESYLDRLPSIVQRYNDVSKQKALHIEHSFSIIGGNIFTGRTTIFRMQLWQHYLTLAPSS